MSPLQPPYPLIRAGLRQGRIIPFLGSGASLVARDPEDAPWRSPLDASWDEGVVSYLPTARELARYLARQSEFPDDEPLELSKVAQYFDVVGGRDTLQQELHSIFSCTYPYTSLHRHLAGIAVPLLIVTTNYDDLIECAFAEQGRPYDLVVHTTDPSVGDQLLWWPTGATEPREVAPNKLDIDLGAVTVIYKMHGAMDRRQPRRGQYVITEDDYIDFLARMTKNKAIPAIFAEPFQTRPFLFLGYGLYDWNLRVVLNRIEKDLRRSRDIRSWAIQRNANALEKRFWQERGVEVYEQTIDAFVERLQPRPAADAAAAAGVGGAAGEDVPGDAGR